LRICSPGSLSRANPRPIFHWQCTVRNEISKLYGPRPAGSRSHQLDMTPVAQGPSGDGSPEWSRSDASHATRVDARPRWFEM
jgi:hypothetical protein